MAVLKWIAGIAGFLAVLVVLAVIGLAVIAFGWIVSVACIGGVVLLAIGACISDWWETRRYNARRRAVG